ncbi:MAG: hypothetical protein WCT44_02580 [Candidatus Paceibacterota bacterium]
MLTVIGRLFLENAIWLSAFFGMIVLGVLDRREPAPDWFAKEREKNEALIAAKKAAEDAIKLSA